MLKFKITGRHFFFFSVPGVEKLEFYHLKLEYFYYATDTLMININVSKYIC